MGIALNKVSKKYIQRLIFLLYITIFHLAVNCGFKQVLSYFPNYQMEIANNFVTVIMMFLPINLTVFLVATFLVSNFSGLNLFKITLISTMSILSPFYILGLLGFINYKGGTCFNGFFAVMLLLALLYMLVPYSRKDLSEGLKSITKFIGKLKSEAQNSIRKSK